MNQTNTAQIKKTNLNIIANVVSTEDKATFPLFLNTTNKDTLSTNTYFNIFHVKNYEFLTNCHSYSLYINNLFGLGDITIWAVSTNEDNNTNTIKLATITYKEDISFTVYNNACTNIEKHINNANKENSVSITFNTKDSNIDFIYFSYDNTLQFANAFYAINKPKRREINLALISTTFNREKDILSLKEHYLDTINSFSDLKTNTHLYIVNNGEEYPSFKELKDNKNPNITYIKNAVNNGGAGGFSLGAQTAYNKNKHTHFIFIDDDALFHKESIFRIFHLLENATDDNANQIISGSMFEKENSTFCHCILEGLNKNNYTKSICGSINLDNTDNLYKSLTTALDTIENYAINKDSKITYSCFDYKKQKVIQVRPYAAWWCCCMPMHFIKDYGLPYPLFFRGDDQEYALRANKKILILNGVCIWHPKFSTKGSLFRTYLGARNYAIVTSLHYKYAKWKILRNTWIKQFKLYQKAIKMKLKQGYEC